MFCTDQSLCRLIPVINTNSRFVTRRSHHHRERDPRFELMRIMFPVDAKKVAKQLQLDGELVDTLFDY